MQDAAAGPQRQKRDLAKLSAIVVDVLGETPRRMDQPNSLYHDDLELWIGIWDLISFKDRPRPPVLRYGLLHLHSTPFPY